MVQKKGTSELFGPGWLDRELERVRKSMGKVVDHRYYVVEITPAQRYCTGDGHGGTEWEWDSGKTVMVSEYFKTKNEAVAWLNAHEPDKGKTLETREEKLYERVVREWH